MSRLLNRQRQLGEQGRLRFGQMVSGTRKNGSTYTRPTSTETWIVTSYSQEHVQTAAGLWGGQVERWKPQGHGAEQWRVITDTNEIPAILPPGNPLFQAYELWSGGGCQRRCNGEVEELSGSLCICRAQFGDAYHEQKQGTVCDDKTRLKVILPDMPGIGSWRMETGSYYAADEIAGFVDLIRGAVGDKILVPIKLTLVPDTVTRDGETKQFIKPVVDLRGRTAGELLAGAPSLALLGPSAPRQAVGGNGPAAVTAPPPRAVAGNEQPAIEPPTAPTAPTAEDFLIRARAVGSFAEFKTIWDEAAAAGISPSKAQSDEMTAIGKRLQAANTDPPAPAPEQQTAAASDVDVLWQAIVAKWPRTMTELKTTFKGAMGTEHNIATENELAAFLKIVDEGRYDAQVTAAVAGLDDQAPF